MNGRDQRIYTQREAERATAVLLLLAVAAFLAGLLIGAWLL